MGCLPSLSLAIFALLMLAVLALTLQAGKRAMVMSARPTRSTLPLPTPIVLEMIVLSIVVSFLFQSSSIYGGKRNPRTTAGASTKWHTAHRPGGIFSVRTSAGLDRGQSEGALRDRTI